MEQWAFIDKELLKLLTVEKCIVLLNQTFNLYKQLQLLLGTEVRLRRQPSQQLDGVLLCLSQGPGLRSADNLVYCNSASALLYQELGLLFAQID